VLKQLRRFYGSTANKIVYALLALAFVWWGVGSFGGHVDVVAEVHGQRIMRRDVDRETMLLQRRYEQIFKGANAPRIPDLRSQALDDLIESALVAHEVHRLGLDVTDDELVTAITRLPELQENGRFSRDLLERFLRSERDRGEFEESIRRDLREQRLRGLIADGVQITDPEVEARYNLDREQADLTFVRIAAADLVASAIPTDQDVEAELKANENRYRTPATVRARYVVYRRAEFEALAKPSDEQVRTYYDAHVADRFTDVEEIHARHILIKPSAPTDEAKAKARTDAEDLLKQIRAGADFAALAKERSADTPSAAKGGDLDFFPRGRMVPTFDAAAFALQPGQVSDVVETPFGFHLIKLEERKPGGPKPFDAVREQITKELTAERSLDLARTQADADRRAVVRGKTLQEAVGTRKVEETPPFAAGADVPDVGRVKAFTDAAFSLDDGEVSDVIETDDAIFMLAPFDRKAPVVPALADIRPQVEADAKKTVAARLAHEKGEKLLASAKTVGLDKAAVEIGAKVDETGSFERRAGTIPKLGPVAALRTDAFTLTPEAPLGPTVYTADGDAIVVALKSRTPADMKDFDSAKAGIRDNLLAQRRQATITSFLEHLKDRAVQEGALRVQADALGRG
jgi:peptidyl-prolyl cis-trans isomerase D